jgi:pyruvate/2-oxoglutarate dehydrogenase complex dihydrolipoamide acyltransferase (E2) component
MTKIGGQSMKYLMAVIAMIVLTSGCSAAKKTGEWLGFESKGAAKEKGVFYAGTDGLVVRDAPKSSAKLIGTLSLHQKVVRSKVTDGYALVRVSGGDLAGWVVNANLLWKLPQATPAAEAEAAPAEETAPPTEPPAEAPPTEPATEAPKEQAPKPRSGASVFDPY